MSTDIRAFLKAADRVQFTEATKANYHGMKARVIAEYGSWDEAKGKKNLLSTMSIPQIIDVVSADKAFASLDDLTQERIGWGRVAENFTAEFLRVWLKDHINTWSRLAQIHARMELDELVTFALGKRDVMKLVNIDRLSKSMHVSIQDQMAAISKNMVQTTVTPNACTTLPTNTTSFQYDVNQVNYDGFQRTKGFVKHQMSQMQANWPYDRSMSSRTTRERESSDLVFHNRTHASNSGDSRAQQLRRYWGNVIQWGEQRMHHRLPSECPSGRHIR